MRRICFPFFILFLCALFSNAIAAAPIQFSDISMTLPNATALRYSIEKKKLYMQTDWTPSQESATLHATTDVASYSMHPTGKPGEYVSDEDFSESIYNIAFTFSSPDETFDETINVDSDGLFLYTEVKDAARTFRRKLSTGKDVYTYTVKDPGSAVPVLPLYSVRYNQQGEVLSYQRKSGENLEIFYMRDDSVSRVDALIPYEDNDQEYKRITWSFQDNCWYTDDWSEIVEYPPYVPDESGPDDPEPDPPSDPNGNGEEPGNGTGGSSLSGDSGLVPSISPYVVTAPALTIRELKIQCNPADLRHLPVENIQITDGVLVLPDQGYDAVSIFSDQEIPMEKKYGQWTCPLPAGSYSMFLHDPSGIISWYGEDGTLLSFMDTESSLYLQSDGSYLYDGTGRENVIAYYNANGYLASYSYHNADETKSVTYDPYGEVLFYSASSSDGYLYRYMDHSWQQLGSDGNWNDCAKPVDVNPSDLPPLLLLEHKTEPIGTWYPNNTAGVIGVSLRDRFPELTKKWYHVLPVDLTIQGTQVFKMVASNLFYIGRVWVTVDGDSVRVQCSYADGLIFPKEEMFRWFTSIDEITHDFLEHPSDSLVYGQSYSIRECFGGAKKALLFVCNKVTYRQPVWNDGTMLVRYWPNIESVKAHRMKAEKMLDEMLTSNE